MLRFIHLADDDTILNVIDAMSEQDIHISEGRLLQADDPTWNICIGAKWLDNLKTSSEIEREFFANHDDFIPNGVTLQINGKFETYDPNEIDGIINGGQSLNPSNITSINNLPVNRNNVSATIPNQSGMPLDVYKNYVSEQLNAYISQQKNRLFSDISTNEMIYTAKYNEATRYLNDSSNPKDMSLYPFIQSAVEISEDENETAEYFANFWVSKHNEWLTITSQLEALRIFTRKKIKGANNEEEIKFYWEEFINNF